MPPTKRLKYLLLFILLISACLRCGVAVYVQRQLDRQPERTYVIEGDADGYWKLAQSLVHGEDYSIYTPPRRVLRMPGFLYFWRAPCQSSENRIFTFGWFLALLGVVACFVVYLLGKELVNESIGLIAAALVAVSPVMAGFSVLIFKRNTIRSHVCWFHYGYLSNYRKSNLEERINFREVYGQCWSGISLAAAFYVRPSWLLILPLVIVIFVVSAKGHRTAAMQRALLLTVGFAVMLAPWVYRNYQVTRHFVPTTLWAGPSLYDGLNPRATGDSDMTFLIKRMCCIP